MVTFNGISVSIPGDDPKEAYQKLSDAMEYLGLEVGGVEWNSGSFNTGEGTAERDTEELIP